LAFGLLERNRFVLFVGGIVLIVLVIKTTYDYNKTEINIGGK
jgi:hypothetical protein